MIPITRVVVDAETEQLVLEVLRSGMLAQGPVVERFEAACREMAAAKHAMAVSNGTVALSVALEALDLQPGAEVITTPFTFVATLNAALEVGAKVRFADISDVDFNLDPAAADELVNEQTAAVMPVHLYGQSADMDPLVASARRVGATIVEDAAQAHGASYFGRPVGTYGMATFSFYATKNLMCGEGGVVTTDDAALADRVRVLRNQGMRGRYEYVVPGHNYRLTDLAAAVAISQFARIETIAAARRENAAYYHERFADLPGIVPPATVDGRVHVFHQYTLRVTADAPIGRDELVARLHADGVGAGVYYPALVHDYACFQGHPLIDVGDTPVARRVATEVVSIPVHQHLTDTEREQVADAVVAAVMGVRR